MTGKQLPQIESKEIYFISYNSTEHSCRHSEVSAYKYI